MSQWNEVLEKHGLKTEDKSTSGWQDVLRNHGLTATGGIDPFNKSIDVDPALVGKYGPQNFNPDLWSGQEQATRPEPKVYPRITEDLITQRLQTEMDNYNKELRQIENEQQMSQNQMVYGGLNDILEKKQNLLKNPPSIDTVKQTLLKEQGWQMIKDDETNEDGWLQFLANSGIPEKDLLNYQYKPQYNQMIKASYLPQLHEDRLLDATKAEIDARFPNLEDGVAKGLMTSMASWWEQTKATVDTLNAFIIGDNSGYDSREYTGFGEAPVKSVKGEDLMQRASERFNKAALYREVTVGDNAAAAFLYDFSQVIPDMVATTALTILTGGTGLAAGLSAKQIATGLFKKETRTAAMKALARKAVVSPELIPMGTKIFAQAYHGNLADGMDEGRAFFTAFVNAYGQSVLEGGGFNKAFKEGGMNKAVDFLKSSFGEGFEEIEQNWWEAAVNMLVGGKDAPLFSTTDESALLNPKREAYSGALGTAAGGSMSMAVGGPSALKSYVDTKTKPEVTIKDPSQDLMAYDEKVSEYEEKNAREQQEYEEKKGRMKQPVEEPRPGATLTEQVETARDFEDEIIAKKQEILLRDLNNVEDMDEWQQRMDEVDDTSIEMIVEELVEGTADPEILDLINKNMKPSPANSVDIGDTYEPLSPPKRGEPPAKPEVVPEVDTSKMSPAVLKNMQERASKVDNEAVLDLAKKGGTYKSIAKEIGADAKDVRANMTLQGIPTNKNSLNYSRWALANVITDAVTGEIDAVSTDTTLPIIAQKEAEKELVRVPALKGAKVSDNLDSGHRYIQKLGKRLGADVVFYDGGPEGVEGVYYRGRTIFINNAEATDGPAVMNILGHEYVHHIKTNHPEIYAGLRDIVEEALTTEQVDKLLTKYKNDKKYQEKLRQDPELLIEEMLADEAGSLFTDKQFWENVNAKDPNLAQRLIQLLKDFINRVLGNEKTDSGNMDVMTQIQVKEFQKRFENAVADIMQGAEATDNPVENHDAVFSIKSLSKALGVEADKKSDGALTFSKTYLTKEDVMKSPQGKLFEYALAKNYLTKGEVDKQSQGLADVFNLMVSNKDNVQMVFEFMSLEVFFAMKANADSQYNTSIDFSAICKKTQDIIDAMSKFMVSNGRGATVDEVIELYAELQGIHKFTPCPQCYVFARWVGVGGLLDNIKRYQDTYLVDGKANTETAKEDIAKGIELIEKYGGPKKEKQKALDTLDKHINTILQRILDHAEEPGDKAMLEKYQEERYYVELKSWLQVAASSKTYKPVPPEILYDLNRASDFASLHPDTWKYRITRGVAAGKQITTYTDAAIGEIIQGINNLKNIKKSKGNPFLNPDAEASKKVLDDVEMKVKRQNLLGGFRFQSFSDFRYEYATDYLLAFLDLQAVGAMAQGYTKVVESVPFFAGGRGSVSMSLISDPVAIVDGKVMLSSILGIDPKKAFELRKQYATAGTILVGMYDDHIRIALADSRIDFVIPFHASGATGSTTNALMAAALGMVKQDFIFSDYEDFQNDKINPKATEAQVELRNLRVKILTGKDPWSPNAKPRSAPPWEITEAEKTLIENDKYLSRLWDTLYNPDSYYYGTTLTSKQAEMIMPWEYWDKSVGYDDPFTNSNRFIEYAESMGLVPRFSGKIVRGKKVITQDYGDILSMPFGWKTLIDRRMYDNNGVYQDQQTVNMTEVSPAVLFPSYGQENFMGSRQEDFLHHTREEALYTLEPEEKFKVRSGPPPKKTIKAYKSFNVYQGKLFPRYVDAKNEVPVGVWLDADESLWRMTDKGKKVAPAATGDYVTFDDGTRGKAVKYRPGWHASDLPIAPQMTVGKNIVDENGIKRKEYYPEKMVFAEIEMAVDKDYKKAAEERSRDWHGGRLVARDADLDYVPEDGYYAYSTNPMNRASKVVDRAMQWYVTGAIKVNRILSDAEVDQLVKEAGLAPIPRKGPSLTDNAYSVMIKEKFNATQEGADLGGQALKDLEKGVQISDSRGKITDTEKFSVKRARTIAKGITDNFVKEGKANLVGRKIDSVEGLAVLAQVLRDPRFETFRYFFVGEKGNIISHTGVTSRMPSTTLAILDEDYWLPNLFNGALQNGARGFYIMHNHPVGDPEPSDGDISGTMHMYDFSKDVPLSFMGHVIINSGKYSVIDKDGNTSMHNLPGWVKDDILTPSKPHPNLGDVLTYTEDLAVIAKDLQTPNGYGALIYLSAKWEIRAIQEIPEETIVSPLIFKRYLRKNALSFGANSAVLVAENQEQFTAGADLIREGYLSEVILTEGYSARRDENVSPDSEYEWMGVKRKDIKAQLTWEKPDTAYDGEVDQLVKEAGLAPIPRKGPSLTDNAYSVMIKEKFNATQEGADLGGQALKDLEKGVQISDSRGKITDTEKFSVKRARTIANGITETFVKEGKANLVGRKIDSTEELAVLAQVLRDPRFETFRYFFVGEKGDIISHTGLSARLPSTAVTALDEDYWLVNLFNGALQNGARGFYIMHNHPSGYPEPSDQDIHATKKLYSISKQGPLDFMGHVIINSNKYSVINERGDTGTYQLPGTNQYTKDSILTPSKPHLSLGNKITGPEGLAVIAKGLQTPDGYATLIYLSTKNEVRAIQEIPVETITNPPKFKRYLKKNALSFGANFVALVAENEEQFIAGMRLIPENYLAEVIKLDGSSARRDFISPNPEYDWMGVKTKDIKAQLTWEKPDTEYDGEKFKIKQPTVEIKMDSDAVKTDLKGRLSEIYTSVVDRTKPIMDVDKRAGKLALNAQVVSGTIEAIATRDLVNRNGEVIGKSLRETVEGFAEDVGFWEYMAQKHNIDRAREGVPVDPGMTIEDSMAYVEEAEKANPEYAAQAQMVTDWIDQFMQEWGVGAGIIDAETYAEWQAMYPSYFPTYREFSDLEGNRNFGPGKRFVDLPSPVKRATGSSRDITNPVGNIIQMVNKVVRTAKYNEVGKALYDGVESNPDNPYAEIVPPGIGMFQSKKLDNVVTVWDNGVPSYLRIKDKALMDSLKGLPRVINNAMMMRKITTAYKGLITTHNPFFAIRNVMRDIPTAYVYGSQDNPLFFFGNLAKAGYQVATNTGGAKRYSAMGGGMSGQFHADEASKYAKLLQPSATKNPLVKGAKGVLKGIEFINNLTEQAPRVAEFNHVLNKTGDVQEALYAAQKVTVNFARGGRVTKSIEPFVPYLNASVQGIDRFIEAFNFKEDPLGALKRMVKAGVLVTTPQIVSYLLSMADDPDEYEKLSQRTKDSYYVFPLGDGKYIKIAKSRELAVVFASLFERVLTRNFEGFAGTVATNFSPVDPFTNNIFAPLMWNLPANKDFAGRAIVPQYMQNDQRSPALQYDDNTTTLAKWIGEKTNLSPKQIDYIIDSYTGVIGDVLLPAMTERAGWGNAVNRVAVQPVIADNAFSSQVVQDFYDRLGEYQQVKTDKNLVENIPSKAVTPEERMYNEMNKIASNVSKTSKYINANLKADDAKVRELKKTVNDFLVRANKAKTVADLARINAEMAAKLYKQGVRE